MACQLRDLSCLSRTNGFALWDYRTAQDTLATVKSHDYLSAASDQIEPGDLIMVYASDISTVLVISKTDTGQVETIPLWE